MKCHKCGEYGHYKSRCPASAEKQKAYLDRERARLGGRPNTLRSAGQALIVTDDRAEEDRSDDGGDRLQCWVRVLTATGAERVVTAQIDTGSDFDLVAPALVRDLRQEGVLMMDKVIPLQVGGGTTEVSEHMLAKVLVTPDDVPTLGHDLTFDVRAAVLEMGHELLIGCKTAKAAGLLSMVLAVQDESVSGSLPELPSLCMDIMDMVDDRNEENEGIVYPTIYGTEEERADAFAVCEEFKELFGPMPHGGSKMTPMHIDFIDGAVLKPAKPRQVSLAAAAVIDENIISRMDKGWMRPSTSPYASPVGATSKPNTTEMRVYGDYRRVNAVTKDVRFPMKNVQGTIARLANKNRYANRDFLKDSTSCVLMTSRLKSWWW